MHRTCNTADKPLSSPGSTGWVERLAPDDPLLDAEEIEIPHAERIRRRRRARAAARAAAAVALALEACGGASAPSLQASDSVLVQLERVGKGTCALEARALSKTLEAQSESSPDLGRRNRPEPAQCILWRSYWFAHRKAE